MAVRMRLDRTANVRLGDEEGAGRAPAPIVRLGLQWSTQACSNHIIPSAMGVRAPRCSPRRWASGNLQSNRGRRLYWLPTAPAMRSDA